MSDWISVKEKMPEEMTLVVAISTGYVPIIAYLFNGVWMDRNELEMVPDYYPVTHWAELPDMGSEWLWHDSKTPRRTSVWFSLAGACKPIDPWCPELNPNARACAAWGNLRRSPNAKV